MRLIQAERGRAEFAPILRKNRAAHLKTRRAIFERAIARGELPAGSNTSALAEFAVAPLIARLLNGNPVDAQFIALPVNTVVAGAASGAAVPPARRA